MCIKKLFGRIFGNGIKLSRIERNNLKDIEKEKYLEKCKELAGKRGVEKAIDKYE